MTLQLGDSNYFTSIRERTIKICVKKDFSDSLVINLNLNKRKSILSFSQLNTSFLSNHLYNDQLYLWIVYEEVIELVHFDLKIAVSNVNIDIVDVVGYTTLISSYSDFGTFSHIQTENTSLGPGLFVSLQFLMRKGSNTIATFVPLDALLVLYLIEKKRDQTRPDNLPFSNLEWVQLVLTGTSEARTYIEPSSVKHHDCMSVYADVDSLDSSALLTRITKSSFSFVASAVNNNGERNTLQFNTSEQFVLDYMEQLSTSILSHGEENINFQAHSAKEYLSPSHGMSKPTTLWECCLALRLVHPSRLDSVLKCNMSLKPWIVLMETLIASRRSDYISQFILSLPSHDTIFESIQLWLRELWQQTKDQVKILSENCIVKHLLQKNTKNLPGIENSEFGLNMVVTLELKRLEVLLNGISRVFEACQTINRAGSSGSSGYSATEEQTLHSITTLLSESQCTRDSVAVIRGLCVDPLFSFRAFLPAPLCTPCTSMSQVLQQRRESAADKAYLYYTPEPLRLTTTLRDVHIDNLCSVLATGGSSMTKSKVYGLFNALICARFDKESIDTLLLSLSQTLFLPSEIASSIIQSQSSTPDRELSHARAITIARQLVLYTCLEATLGVMNIDQIDLDVTLLSSQILKVAESVGFSLRLSVSEISFIVSLWKIDANFYVSSAVNELGRHLHSLERIDPLYLQVAVQRLLALGGEDASIGVRKLIGLFFHSASPVGSMMRSQFGVTAIAASGLSESLYMKAWLTAQRLCEESQMPSVDQILARGLVVLMIARWSALTGPAVLDEFLKAPMDENDTTVVKLYLLSLADQEVRASRPTGWTVRLTCAWLLQRRFITEARELHDRYKTALVSSPGVESWTLDANSEEIQRLLDAYDSVTKVNTKRYRGADTRVNTTQLDSTIVTQLAAHNPTFKSGLPALPATWFGELFKHN